MTDAVKQPENLTYWFSDEMAKQGHSDPTAWEVRKKVVKETNPGEPLIELFQILQINRAIRYLLADSELNTFDIRMLIIDGPDVPFWKTNMKNYVIPFLVKNQI